MPHLARACTALGRRLIVDVSNALSEAGFVIGCLDTDATSVLLAKDTPADQIAQKQKLMKEVIDGVISNYLDPIHQTPSISFEYDHPQLQIIPNQSKSYITKDHIKGLGSLQSLSKHMQLFTKQAL